MGQDRNLEVPRNWEKITFTRQFIWYAHTLSFVWHLGTPLTVTLLVLLSVGFLRLKYWCGLPFPTPGDLLTQNNFVMPPALAGRFFTSCASCQSVSSVTQSCPTLCNPMNHSTQGFPVHHQLSEPTQTHVHCVGDAIQPSHPLLSPSAPVLHLSQHQGLFQWVSSSYQVAQVLELQHQPLQWIFRVDFL